MPSPNSHASFFRLLNSLPQELHDEITTLAWPLVCSMKPPKLVTINKSYKPPPQLQINHLTRNILAPIYYSNTTFIGHYHDIKKWIISLSPIHSTMAMKIRCWVDAENQEHLQERNRELVMALGFVGWYNRSLQVYGSEWVVGRSVSGELKITGMNADYEPDEGTVEDGGTGCLTGARRRGSD